MKASLTLTFLSSFILSFSQNPTEQYLHDPAITWMAISEISVDLEDNRLVAEQLIGDQFNCVRSLKTDIQQYPQWSADKFLSQWLIQQINEGKLSMQSLESGLALDVKQLQKALILGDTIVNDAGAHLHYYRHQVPKKELFTYFILKQLWSFNLETNTLHNQLLGIIPVHIHPLYPGDEEPLHQQLGWIPFANKADHRPEINEAELPSVKIVTSSSAFSDWEVIKGETSAFIKAYFFTAARQDQVNIIVPTQDTPWHPSSGSAYFYAEPHYKASVIYGISKTQADVNWEISEATPERISEVIGMTFDQYIYVNTATGQLASYLDLIGPLARGYLDEGYSEYSWKPYYYTPIYYILQPSRRVSDFKE